VLAIITSSSMHVRCVHEPILVGHTVSIGALRSREPSRPKGGEYEQLYLLLQSSLMHSDGSQATAVDGLAACSYAQEFETRQYEGAAF
jgi:hypothetical protein